MRCSQTINPPQTVCHDLTYLWSAPTTAIGLLFLPLALFGEGEVHFRDGILEICGPLVAGFLKHCTLLQGGASAMTLGQVVIARDQFLLDLTRSHERIHVRQCERWGPFFLPAYLLASIIAMLKGRDPYRDNPFEREAYENE
ncbi:MAG TPA: hypothetical protein VIL86_01395 [Tepidisphaeraceae bacterium]|jgi:hypothetical protein